MEGCHASAPPSSDADVSSPFVSPTAKRADRDAPEELQWCKFNSATTASLDRVSFDLEAISVHEDEEDKEGQEDDEDSISFGSPVVTKTRSIIDRVTKRGRTTTMTRHPLQDHAQLLSCIKLLRADALATLPCPMPRCQDITDADFRQPSAGDIVVSVSHAWRNQVHPDPLDNKRATIQEMLEGIKGAGRGQETLLFFDFLSITQRPFRDGQADRTPQELESFSQALKCMHNMYFLSDRIIHLAFEGAQIPSEGECYHITGADLRCARFIEVAGAVQVTGHANSAGACAAFDRVLAVNGEVVFSLEHLQAKMQEAGASQYDVQLERLPFGKVNAIHPDSRGWVFLERFITMVKCAMLDKEHAMDVVISDSDAILEQIREGADRMRTAALLDTRSCGAICASRHRSGGALKSVLREFLDELVTKRFSAASTDKLMLDASDAAKSGGNSAQKSDKDVVAAIMEEFVEHLSEHWHEEAAKQRSRALRLGTKLKQFLFQWECFSGEYAERIADASTKQGALPMLLVSLLPPFLAVPSFLYPYARPDLGWEAQTSYWLFGSPLRIFTVQYLFPRFLANSARLKVDKITYAKFLAWNVFSVSLCLAATLLAAVCFDVFPVPSSQSITAVVVGCLVPLLWFCVPAEKRREPSFRRRSRQAALVALCVAMFGVVFPMLDTTIKRASHPLQLVLVGLLALIKIAFEYFGSVACEHIGADFKPSITFLAVFAYEVNICFILSATQDWVIAAELIAFDVIENCFHLQSLQRQALSVKDKTQALGRQQYIMATLLLREFVEILAPLQSLIILAMQYYVQPQFNDTVCKMSPHEFYNTAEFILADLGVELFVFVATYTILRLRGASPLVLLRGLVVTEFHMFMATAVAMHAYFLCMQHSHSGADTTSTYAWIRDHDASWECGLRWAYSN